MTPIGNLGPSPKVRPVSPVCRRHGARRCGRKRFAPGHFPRLLLLEDRTLPSGLPSGVFELDGNAVRVGTPPPDDWSTTVAAGHSTTCNSTETGAVSGSVRTTFVCDIDTELPGANDQSYFKGGGSKDVNDIPQWQWG